MDLCSTLNPIDPHRSSGDQIKVPIGAQGIPCASAQLPAPRVTKDLYDFEFLDGVVTINASTNTGPEKVNQMITTIEQGRYFHIAGESQSQIDDDINAACELVRGSAREHGWMGILVTRHGGGVYTVALSAMVPYGITAELDAYASGVYRNKSC